DGGLVQAGSGILTLTGINNDYRGGTVIENGSTLRVGNGGSRGDLPGDVVNNGTLIFDRSNNVLFGGQISGNGGLVQAGSGTLTLIGINTYAGGTTIEEGSTLQVGTPGSGGTLPDGDVVNNGTLIFGRMAS